MMARLIAALLSVLCLGACNDNMANQPKVNTHDSLPLAPIAGTVARGAIDPDSPYVTGRVLAPDRLREPAELRRSGQREPGPRASYDPAEFVQEFPLAVTIEVLERGRERFTIYCSPCHGPTGAGDGMVVRRGFVAPESFHQQRLREDPPGRFVAVMREGYGSMYSYAARVNADDRWAIAAYIRALQLSQNATLEDAPPEWRAKLEAP